MPIYSYKCSSCGVSFDRLVKSSQADQAQPCPACSTEGAQRQVTAPGGFDLKGTGWYSKGSA